VPPLVSVIIPTFNRWPLIGEAVDSVLRQSFTDFELIIVDDGSTDETAAGLAGYGSALRIVSTPRKGVAAARNTGVGQSAGRYLAFLDSDDLWLPRKLGRQTELMRAHPDVQICQTDELWLRNGVRVNPKARHRKRAGDIFVESLELCLISPSAVMMTRALFDRAGGFDEAFPVCEDYDLWLRITAEESVGLIAERLIVKRGGHADQLSRSMWGMDRYRALALQKVLRAGLAGPRRAAALGVLRRKVGVLASGARKRGKWREAEEYEMLLRAFSSELNDVGERDTQLRASQGLSAPNA
jgi:glycosyltransferase involved in cell wall biosynthesis